MNDDIGFDFGNFDFSFDFDDFDTDGFGIGADQERLSPRYTKPKIHHMKESHVLYDNATKLARELRLEKDERSDVFVSGTFIFGDFIEAYLTTHMAKALTMTISTLSMSQNNIDSLENLLVHEYIDRLNLIVSGYFYSHERRGLVPYIYEKLDIGDRFQLAVADIHTKTCHFHTLGGRKIVIHGSANLRSCGNIEQFTIEENESLFDFYDRHLSSIIERYSTINKAIRGKDVWKLLTSKPQQP